MVRSLYCSQCPRQCRLFFYGHAMRWCNLSEQLQKMALTSCKCFPSLHQSHFTFHALVLSRNQSIAHMWNMQHVRVISNLPEQLQTVMYTFYRCWFSSELFLRFVLFHFYFPFAASSIHAEILLDPVTLFLCGGCDV